MLYALLGTGLAGLGAALYAIYLKTKLAASSAELTLAQSQAKLYMSEYSDAIKKINSDEDIYKAQLASINSELSTVKAQRDQALDQLSRSGSPGSVADLLRSHAGVTIADPSAK